MFGLFSRAPASRNLPDPLRDELRDLRGLVAAINKSRASIEFSLDGTILNANDNFLQVVGYTLDELRGQHHRLFIDPAERDTPAYRAFWEKLGRGEFDAGQYKRFAKGGRELWLQAIYNPILGEDGRPYKVVKFANDITALKLRQADTDGQLAAINRSQAVIEFSLSGEILDANANFCEVMGYTREELRGQHHRLFIASDEQQGDDYRLFWEKLGRGEFDAGQYRRMGKGGREVWIQASYNPIFDASHRPFKVVKYATDVTQQVLASRALALAVSETREVIASAEAGDLTRRLPIGDKAGQIRELCTSLNGLLDMVADVIERIRLSADTVNVATREISQGNADLSSRTEEQASSVQETASTMEELMSTVRTNSDNAVKASQLARNAQQVAEAGGRVVSDVVDTMSAIQQSSHRIADIIGVIDGIAFQTNILALNAAVEAARAGEQGRGFAVVATEVRSLAQRSANAAKEIKGLIADSSGKVQQGSRLVDKAGSTMRDVVHGIQTVADLMAGISSASQQQSAGIEQVSLAVSQMDQTTQQNAALVEQAAAAAESLEEQARELVRIISRFSPATEVPVLAAPRPARTSLTAPPRNAQRAVPARLAKSAEDEWAEF